MIIEMLPGASHKDVKAVKDKILDYNRYHRGVNLQPIVMKGAERVVIGIAGLTQTVDEQEFYGNGVNRIERITEKYKLVNIKFHPYGTIVDIEGVKVGGEHSPKIIAGPCAVEGKKEIMDIAYAVKQAGADILRGGARKPRTSPYDFQGLGYKGILYLALAAKNAGMPVETEATGEDKDNIEAVAKHLNVIHIGARNGQNFELIRKAGRLAREYGTAILLKRHPSNTIDEFLCAAEYAAVEYLGKKSNGGFYLPIMLCLRGITSPELIKSERRNTADLDSILELREKTHLPIIFDASHSSGKREYVRELCRAAISLGAHGLMVETHLNPKQAKSDPRQQVTPDELREIVNDTIAFYTARKICDRRR